MTPMSRIITTYADGWLAYYDDDEADEDGERLMGFGATPYDAEQDLIEQDKDRAWVEGYYEPHPEPEYEPDLGC